MSSTARSGSIRQVAVLDGSRSTVGKSYSAIMGMPRVAVVIVQTPSVAPPSTTSVHGDVSGLVGEQEGHRIGDVLWLGDTPQGMPGL